MKPAPVLGRGPAGRLLDLIVASVVLLEPAEYRRHTARRLPFGLEVTTTAERVVALVDGVVLLDLDLGAILDFPDDLGAN